MKQINVCVGVKTSNCGKQCDRLCNFFAFGKCILFEEILKEAKVRAAGERYVYLRCEDCIDHEE